MEIFFIPISVCLPHQPSDFIIKSFHSGRGRATDALEQSHDQARITGEIRGCRVSKIRFADYSTTG
jgi:hypothetical protein